MELTTLIAAARGNHPADLVIRGGRVVNVLTGEVYAADVAIIGDRIAGVGSGYEGREVIDAAGALVMPGFLDGHVHIESSMCSPGQFAQAVVPHGTTCVIIDAHEIANVCGLPGLAFMLDDAARLPLDVYMMLPSCVPASPFESAKTVLKSTDLGPLLAKPQVLGMGEMMNFPGVLHQDPEVMAKLGFTNLLVDGHAPDLTGKDLCAYVAAGISSDHECRTVEEAMEKLRLGVHVMIREGSIARNLVDLLGAVTPTSQERCMFVTDDRHADDLLHHGHIDNAVRKAIAHGMDPVLAVKLATINCARYFQLDRVGAIAPGWQADIVLADGFENLRIDTVIKSGRVVARQGRPLFCSEGVAPAEVTDTMRVAQLDACSFRVPAPIEADSVRARVIGVVPGQCWSHALERDLPARHGEVLPDPSQDIAKIAVVERHHATGNIGVGFVEGFGIRGGAIASTVAHDAHNLVVMGTNDADMRAAVEALVQSQGGLCAVKDGQVVELLPLPIAGIMSDQPMPWVADRIEVLQAKTREALGITVDHPYMTLAFLALSVIPELKLTDRGYIDVHRFEVVSVLA
ncbi:MAG TPA: adenine deaminase [Pantanalinema sp.]